MLAILILATLSNVTHRQYAAAKAPVPGASCYKSSLVLGYDNVPISSGRATTVTDISVILAPRDTTPAVWIYKNVSGEYWAQGNLVRHTFIAHAFTRPLAEAFLKKPFAGRALSSLTRLTNVGDVLRQAEKAGGVVVHCFTGEMPHKYAKDVVK